MRAGENTDSSWTWRVLGPDRLAIATRRVTVLARRGRAEAEQPTSQP